MKTKDPVWKGKFSIGLTLYKEDDFILFNKVKKMIESEKDVELNQRSYIMALVKKYAEVLGI